MTKKKIMQFLNSKIGKVVFLLFIFIFFFSLVLNNVGLALREKISIGSTLDFSWMSDSIERLLHGYILGKDFTFTYGPLFQLIYSLPSIILHVPSYISVAIAPLISFVVIFLFVFLISKYISNNFFERIAYILLLFIIVGLLNPTSDIVRVLMPMWYGLVFFETFKNRLNWLKYCLVCIFPTFIGLYSYNLFVIALLFSAAFVVFKLFTNPKKWDKNLPILLVIPAILIFQVIFSLLFTHNLNYILNSLDSVYNYRYIGDLSWAWDRNNILFIFPIALVFLGIYMIKTKITSSNTINVLLVLILSSFAGLITAISRSDAGHILVALYPSIITFFTIVFVISKKNRALITVAFVFYLLVPFKPTFYNTFAPKNMLQVMHVIPQKPSFLSIYRLSENYYSENEINDVLKIIKENKGKVYVYPYDSYLLNAEGTTFNSFALGVYVYSNSIVEENTVKGFRSHPPSIIILAVDTKGALNLDDIPSFTRNPLIAKWIIGNYTVYQKTSKYLVLSFNPNKKTVSSGSCLAHQLSANLAGKESLLQKAVDVIKPATYYLGTIRLPYSPVTKSYLVFNDVFTSSGLAALFGNKGSTLSSINIPDKNGNLEITRVSAFLGKKETKIFSKNEFSFKCVTFNN